MLGDGWIVTNWLGLFVLLSIFVLAHVVAAITSFRMITLIPHHIPRMIGFSSANRVDMDQFAQGAALIGTQKAVGQIASGVQTKRIASDSGSAGGQGGQKQIGSAAKERNNSSSGSRSGIDTTTQATMAMGGGSREPEGDEG